MSVCLPFSLFLSSPPLLHTCTCTSSYSVVGYPSKGDLFSFQWIDWLRSVCVDNTFLSVAVHPPVSHVGWSDWLMSMQYMLSIPFCLLLITHMFPMLNGSWSDWLRSMQYMLSIPFFLLLFTHQFPMLNGVTG